MIRTAIGILANDSEAYAAPLHNCKYRWLHAPDLNPISQPG